MQPEAQRTSVGAASENAAWKSINIDPITVARELWQRTRLDGAAG
jgi:hypothetical protein